MSDQLNRALSPEEKQKVIDTIMQAIETENAKNRSGKIDGPRRNEQSPARGVESNEFVIRNLEVFSGDGDSEGPKLTDSVFLSGETCYIGIRVHFEPQSYSRNARLQWRIYHEDGEPVSDVIEGRIGIGPNEDFIHHQWGWDSPGNWEPGNYVIAVAINGCRREKIRFEIVRGQYDALTTQVSSVKLVNSTGQIPPTEALIYNNVFEQSEAARIYFQFEFDCPQRDLYTIYEYCIKDEYGNNVCNVIGEAEIEADYCVYWFGYGWDEPGNWRVGKYTYTVSLGKGDYYSGEFYIRGTK